MKMISRFSAAFGGGLRNGFKKPKKSWKPAIAALLAAILLCSMLPLSISAEDLSAVSDGGIGFNYGDSDFLLVTMPTTEGCYTYGLWGPWDTEETAVNAASLPSSSWDWEWAVQKEAAGYRMILNGVSGDYATASNLCDGLLYKCDLTLELRGSNRFRMDASGAGNNAAIRGIGDLTIEGEGSLTLSGFYRNPAHGIVVDGAVVISGGKLQISAENDAVCADSVQLGSEVYALASEDAEGKNGQNYTGGSLSGKRFLQTAYASSGANPAVSFSPNQGTGTMDSVNAKGAYALPTNGFTAPVGMQFKGWKVNDIEYAVGDRILVTSDTVVTAVWEDDPNTFTVKFAANGGSGSMAAAKGIAGEYTLPANGFTNPAGKQFKGWSVSSTEYAPGDTINVAADTVVTALWEDDSATIAIHFDGNGGSGYMNSVADTSAFSYTLPANGFGAANYISSFGGWLVNGVVMQPGDTITVTEDITVKALWNNLSVSGVAVTHNNTDNITASGITSGTVSYNPATQTLTLNNATIYSTYGGGTMTSAINTGHYFDGTLTINLVGNNTIYGDLVSGPATSSHRYAIIAKDLAFKGSGSLTVTASEAESGSFYYAIESDNDIRVESGCTITAIAKPYGLAHCAPLSYSGSLITNGSTILGSTSASGTPIAPYKELGAAAKYAKILPAYNVTVSFVANGGSGTMADQAVVCGDEYPLPECEYAAPLGKQFKAWSVNGAEKKVGDIVYFAEDTAITALWEERHICNLQPVEKDWPTCTQGGKEAYYKCDCGKGYEDLNGLIVIPDIESWGNLPKLDHTPSGWKQDSEKHWKECTNANCGIVIEGSEAAHSATGANAATCLKAAVCDDCGISYGTVANHRPKSAWSKDASGHWHDCTTEGCTEKLDFATHTPDHQGGATEEYPILCTACGRTLEPQLNHIHRFDQEVAEEEYLASEANCLEPAKYYFSCACGAKGTETFSGGAANGHTEGTEWKNDEHHHWHLCTVADCGAIIDHSKAEHTPDRAAATATDPIRCAICAFKLAPALGHTHAYPADWKSDAAKHWKECACKNKANAAAHTDKNADGKCDVCAFTVGNGGNASSSPQTGDSSNPWLWFALLTLSAAGLFGLAFYNRKKEANKS